MLPKGWRCGQVSDLIERLESGVSVNGEDRPKLPGEIGVLKVSAVSYGYFDETAYKTVIKEDELRAKLTPKQGQIIISRSNTDDLVGASAYIEKNYPDLYLCDKLWQTVPRKNIQYDSKWLAYLLGSSFTRNRLSALASGTSGSMKNISKDTLINLTIHIPSFTEQKKIAKILSIWDQAISTTEKLLANSQQQKKALMQQLLTGKHRFSDFYDSWAEFKLSALIYEVKNEVVNNPKNYELLSVKLHCKGIVRTGKYPAATEGSRPYFFRNEGELIIGRQNLHNGGIGIVPKEVSGCIASNAISSFKVRNHVSKKFIFYRMSTPSFFTRIDNLIGGTGQKEISVRELFKVKIKLPSFDEQQKIAQVLTAADREIETLQQKLACLKQEKKALMQQLLTGKRRVKVDES